MFQYTRKLVFRNSAIPAKRFRIEKSESAAFCKSVFDEFNLDDEAAKQMARRETLKIEMNEVFVFDETKNYAVRNCEVIVNLFFEELRGALVTNSVHFNVADPDDEYEQKILCIRNTPHRTFTSMDEILLTANKFTRDAIDELKVPLEAVPYSIQTGKLWYVREDIFEGGVVGQKDMSNFSFSQVYVFLLK